MVRVWLLWVAGLAALAAGCVSESPEPFGTVVSAAADCSPTTFQSSCGNNRLTTCEFGVRITRECGAYTCNAVTATCGFFGNGVIDPGEQCDDANASGHDGCMNNCRVGPLCDPATFLPTCTGNALVTCDNGIESRQACGAGTCNAVDGRCGRCGDGVRTARKGPGARVCPTARRPASARSRPRCGLRAPRRP